MSPSRRSGFARPISRLADRLRRRVARLRARYDGVDHLFRAVDRYRAVFGGRLAAAIAYYGFFATFALGLLAYSVLGFLLEYPAVEEAVAEYLAQNLPVIETRQITAGRGAASLVALLGLLLAGVAWVDTLRSAQRLVWRLDQAPGNIVLRRGLDVLVLPVLGLLLIGSVAVAVGLQNWLGRLPTGQALARPVGLLLTLGVNLLVAVALLAVLPRLRISPRRLLPPASLVAAGLLLLSTLGRLYISQVQHNPAYAVVATAAGLLIVLYLFHQLVLLGAAWAATARSGRVVDLAFGSETAPGRPSPPAAA